MSDKTSLPNDRWKLATNVSSDEANIQYSGDEAYVPLRFLRTHYGEVHHGTDRVAHEVFAKHFTPLVEACAEVQEYRRAFRRIDAMRRELRETELRSEQAALNYQRAMNDPKLSGKSLAQRLGKLEQDQANARSELEQAEAGRQAFEQHVTTLRQRALDALEVLGREAMGKSHDELQAMLEILRRQVAAAVQTPLDSLLTTIYVRRELALNRETWSREFLDKPADTDERAAEPVEEVVAAAQV
jgi:hypothetical protein